MVIPHWKRRAVYLALVNGTTITQVEVDEVTYWHVELDSHDVILAEGPPAESYLEMGNRALSPAMSSR